MVQSLVMAEKSVVYFWLKSLSPSLKIEPVSPQFENWGFHSTRSRAYVKLLLGERPLLVRQIGARIVGFMVKAPNFAQR